MRKVIPARPASQSEHTSAQDRFFTNFAARACGYHEKLHAGLCPACGRAEPEKTIRDDASRVEFAITGLCQSCQDRTFD